jgi:hypothetical protein
MKLPAEEALQQFVHSAQHYFERETWSSLVIQEPIIELNFIVPEGVQGWVKISGLASGWVMFTAPVNMVADLVKHKLGEDARDGDCEDYMREMASVVVSNSRRELGAGLKIELPDPAEKINSHETCGHRPVFVVLMQWKNYQAHMVIALELDDR